MWLYRTFWRAAWGASGAGYDSFFATSFYHSMKITASKFYDLRLLRGTGMTFPKVLSIKAWTLYYLIQPEGVLAQLVLQGRSSAK